MGVWRREKSSYRQSADICIFLRRTFDRKQIAKYHISTSYDCLGNGIRPTPILTQRLIRTAQHPKKRQIAIVSELRIKDLPILSIEKHHVRINRYISIGGYVPNQSLLQNPLGSTCFFRSGRFAGTAPRASNRHAIRLSGNLYTSGPYSYITSSSHHETSLKGLIPLLSELNVKDIPDIPIWSIGKRLVRIMRYI